MYLNPFITRNKTNPKCYSVYIKVEKENGTVLTFRATAAMLPLTHEG